VGPSPSHPAPHDRTPGDAAPDQPPLDASSRHKPALEQPADLHQWQLALRVFATPADTNPYGDIFGGWLLSQADIAAATVAVARARGRVATVAIKAFQFSAPVQVGDLVDLYARLHASGKSSVTVDVSIWTRRASIPGQTREVANGRLVFVAVDAEGKTRRLPSPSAGGVDGAGDGGSPSTSNARATRSAT
jgi:acyl-CoA thioesterase YciA